MFSACVRQENDHLGAMGDIWTDVTDVCRKAASELDNVQSMLHVDHFTLKETMSAVELMDKKMDQCMGLQGSIQTKDLLTPDIPSGGYSMASALNILQILMVYESSFLGGASVLESTHNCIYLWEGSWTKLEGYEGLPQRIILAYCRSLHQSLRNYTKLVLDVDIYEDEDCQPLLAPTLIDSLMNKDISDEVKAVMKDLEDKEETDEGTARSIKEEILALLRCRLAFNDLISTIEDCTLAFMKLAGHKRKRNVVPSKEDNQLLEALWRQGDERIASATTCFNALEVIANTSTTSNEKVMDINVISKMEREGINKVGDRYISSGAQTAFSFIVCKLAQNGPIRHVPLHSYTESIKAIITCIHQLTHVRAIQTDLQNRANGSMLSCFEKSESKKEVDESGVTFDYVFSATLHCADKHFHLLPRCVLCGYLNYVTSLDIGTHLLPNSMRDKGMPDVLRKSDLVTNEWVPNSLFVLYWEILKMLCTHRNKMVPKSENVLHSYCSIIDEARYLDETFLVSAGIEDPRQVWCSHWVCTTLIQVMYLHWRLLSECELLSADELDVYYAYGEFLIGFRMRVEEELGTLRYGLSMINYDNAVKEGKKGAMPPDRPSYLNSPALFSLAAEREMCRGMAFTAAALSGPGLRASNAMKRHNPHCSWEMRFKRRFQAFSKIGVPPMLNFEYCRRDFKLAPVSGGAEAEELLLEEHEDPASTKVILDQAATNFTTAKNALNRVRAIAKEMKACNKKVSNTFYATELDDQNALDNATDNMRVALTCWANCNKLIGDILDAKDSDLPKRRMIVDQSLSPIYPSMSIV